MIIYIICVNEYPFVTMIIKQIGFHFFQISIVIYPIANVGYIQKDILAKYDVIVYIMPQPRID